MCIRDSLKCWGAWGTTCQQKAKDITASSLEERHRRRGKHLTIFSERTRKGHNQTDQHHCFTGNAAKTFERQDGAFMGFPKPIDTNLNWADSPRQTYHSVWNLEKIRLNIPCHHSFHHITVWPAGYNHQAYTLSDTGQRKLWVSTFHDWPTPSKQGLECGAAR